MLIYFLGKVQANEFEGNDDFCFFEKIGSFAKALKFRRPELIFAGKEFANSSFDLKNFLCEQKVGSPLLFLGKDAFSCRDKEAFLYKIKSRCKIPQKLFELLKCLYNSQKAQSLEQIKSGLCALGMDLTDNNACVSLSRLKKLLRSQDEFNIDLVKEEAGYRLVFF